MKPVEELSAEELRTLVRSLKEQIRNLQTLAIQHGISQATVDNTQFKDWQEERRRKLELPKDFKA